MENSHSLLRAKICAGRELIGYSQKDLANYLGISHSKVSKAETGETKSSDVLLELKEGLEALGVVFTRYGVELSHSRMEVLEGDDCYIQLLDKVAEFFTSQNDSPKDLLILFASDSVSPPAVNDRYRRMRNQGVQMRQIIREGDTFIMGELEEYRCIPGKYFKNVVRLVFGDCVAIVNGTETRIILYYDGDLAECERNVFTYFWDTGKQPAHSDAGERF